MWRYEEDVTRRQLEACGQLPTPAAAAAAAEGAQTDHAVLNSHRRMSDQLARLDDHIVTLCAGWLPVHPRPFATAARASKRLQRAVDAVRGELGERVCEEHGLESARGEAAGKKLIELVDRVEAVGVLRLVVARAPLDMQDHRGDTALIRAVSSGYSGYKSRSARAEIALALIGAGAGLDLQNKKGQTALMETATTGATHVVTALIGAGAGLDLQSQSGDTALTWAAAVGCTKTVLALIGAGAALDTAERKGMNALMHAASNGDVKIALALIEAGARLDLRDECGRNAVFLAARNEHTDVATIIHLEQQKRLCE